MASVLGGDYSRAIPIVSSFFTVKDFQHNFRDDYLQFLIAESEVRHKFPTLLGQLGKIGMVATVTKSHYVRWLMPTLRSARLSVNGGAVLTVHKLPKHKTRNSLLRFLPIALFIVTVSVVFVDGILKSDSTFARVGISDPVTLAAVYTFSLMGILGIHELGHMLAAREHGVRISWPYFIPMYPGIFSPTLGAMIRLKSSLPNRNAMFDVGISGPIAGLIVTVIVSIYGSSISVLIPADEADRLLGENELLKLNPSVLMMATMELTGTIPEDMVVVMSPIMFAAWLGFLLTFLNLMPASQLDGGHIARATLGAKPHRVITFASIGVLFVLYPVMALLVLIIALRVPESPPLDDVTPLSQNRRILFVVALVLAALCAPIPPYLI